MFNEVLKQAESALFDVQKALEVTPEQISQAREIQRMYEPCKDDLIKKLWVLVSNSPSKTDDNKELAHWQGMIDAYVGILIRYYQALKVVNQDKE